MKPAIMLMIVLVVAVSVLPVGAQGDDEAPELVCELADLELHVNAIEQQVQTAVAAEDAQTVYDSLIAARRFMTELDSLCLGLDFEGDSSSVVGPVFIPEGVYRVNAAVDDFFIMQVVPLTGECGARFGALFNESSSDSPGRVAQALLTSGGCEAVFEISNVDEAFSVTFEKLG